MLLGVAGYLSRWEYAGTLLEDFSTSPPRHSAEERGVANRSCSAAFMDHDQSMTTTRRFASLLLIKCAMTSMRILRFYIPGNIHRLRNLRCKLGRSPEHYTWDSSVRLAMTHNGSLSWVPTLLTSMRLCRYAALKCVAYCLCLLT